MVAHVRQKGGDCFSLPQFPKQLDSLPGQFSNEATEPGHIPARSRQTCHDAHPERLADRGHHDRNCFGRFLCGTRGRRTPGHDQVDSEPNQLRRKLRKKPGIAVRRTVLKNVILVFDIAEFA